MYGVIGDAHLGFKAYDTDKRTEEVSKTFKVAVELLSDLPVIVIPGDLLDDTTWSNWVEREFLALKEAHKDQVWVIDGGNHDSTKTYSSVSALDVLDKIPNVEVINSFKPRLLEVNGLTIFAIPHMKSQGEFLSAIDQFDEEVDIVLMHCMVDSGLDLGPNDLNIDIPRLQKLSNLSRHVWIGHQHGATRLFENVYIPGGVVEFNFGELGEKFVYRVNKDQVDSVLIPQPRKLEQLDILWEGPLELLDICKDLKESSIYKIVIDAIPVEDYSNAKSTVDVIVGGFKGDIVYALHKTGHVEVQVTEIEASFDLLEEFDIFSSTIEVEDKAEMRLLLEDTISELIAEEAD